MMEHRSEEFFHDFRQDLLVGAEANGSFQLSVFMETIASELVETGFVDGFELCDFKAPRGMRVDGYWFNDEGILDLFIADFDSRNKLVTLTKTEVVSTFKRLSNFFESSITKDLSSELEVTSPGFGLAQQIADRKSTIRKLNFVLFSERILSEKLQTIPDTEIVDIPVSYHIWDISRLHRQRSSRGHKEPLNLDFVEMFGQGIPCLPAHLGADTFPCYLMIMPGNVLATLYEKFGARLLEQNVRTFLQARGNVNQGIRTTILSEPKMFFAYNNGVTATAQSIETKITETGLVVINMIDLQIVNGGQTTASLFHTRKRDQANLSEIFVQMKLSVISSQDSEKIVPRISEYANTQNRVNAADFFSNHRFHVRMEEFSRRIWAPAQKGVQRETKWFYERARGQYVDAQSKLTLGEQRRFKTEHPKSQMFTKTDLAKFENVWDDHPRWVNLGSQKNFARYAARIGGEWDKSSNGFNESYFKRAVARALIFRASERIVSAQPWYNGGYRANIVAYTLSILSELVRRKRACFDFLGIWNMQTVNASLENTIAAISKLVNEDITKTSAGISNVTEWCKKEACWTRILGRIADFEKILPDGFNDQLLSIEDHAKNNKDAIKTQDFDNGIEAQSKVLSVPPGGWRLLQQALLTKNMLTPKEIDIMKIAVHIPSKIPTVKQCAILLEILERGRAEGVKVG